MRLDLYPVTVSAPDGTYQRVRVVVTDEGRAVLFGRGPEGIGQVRESGLTADPPSGHEKRRPFVLSTEDGAWHVNQEGGCGCGDPLKRYDVATALGG